MIPIQLSTVAEAATVRAPHQDPEGRPVPHSPSHQTWTQWQQDVLAVLRSDFRELLQEIALDDVDWPAWHAFYIQGRSPRAAVDRALERDF